MSLFKKKLLNLFRKGVFRQTEQKNFKTLRMLVKLTFLSQVKFRLKYISEDRINLKITNMKT